MSEPTTSSVHWSAPVHGVVTTKHDRLKAEHGTVTPLHGVVTTGHDLLKAEQGTVTSLHGVVTTGHDLLKKPGTRP